MVKFSETEGGRKIIKGIFKKAKGGEGGRIIVEILDHAFQAGFDAHYGDGHKYDNVYCQICFDKGNEQGRKEHIICFRMKQKRC